MSARTLVRWSFALIAQAACLLSWYSLAEGKEVLVVDRTRNSVYRYTEDGNYIDRLIHDDVHLNEPTGIQMSPDGTKLFVSSSQSNQVVIYDYSFAAGTATYSSEITGLSFPNAIKFSPSGEKLYVSNLGGGVSQFNASDYSSAGGLIAGGDNTQATGLEFAEDGALLVGGFDGVVSKSDAAISSLSNFIGPDLSLAGASGILRVGNDLYVTALLAGAVYRYNATTGAHDPSFSLTGLSFPQALMAAPDGNGLLIGVLGLGTGGTIVHYDFDGNELAPFATFALDPTAGFSEPTAMLTVPEPSAMALATIALGVFTLAVWRRAARA